MSDAEKKQPIKEMKMAQPEGGPQPIYDDNKTINDADEWQAVRDSWAKEQADKLHIRMPQAIQVVIIESCPALLLLRNVP